MDALEFAVRQYQLVVPRDLINRGRIGRDLRFPRARLEAWLRDSVLPAIQRLWNRARFRKAATWAQQAFRPGVKTDEWRLVGQLASVLRQSARDVLLLANMAAKQSPFPTSVTATSMLEQLWGEPRRAGADMGISKTVEWTTEKMPASLQKQVDTALAVLQLQAIKNRKADDLIAIDDYFGPVADRIQMIDGQAVTVGAFTSFANPRLGHVGNHIIRAMLTRVRLDRDALERVRRPAHASLKKHLKPKVVARDAANWDQLKLLIERVDNEFLTSEQARLNESCMVLVQLLLDLSESSPDTDWLGLPDSVLAFGRQGTIRHQLSSGIGFQTAERIARALADVQQLYQGASDEPEKEEAIAAGNLVVSTETQEVYWQRRRVAADWSRHRAPWEFFLLLVQRGRSRQAVFRGDLFPDDPRGPRSTMHNRWRRLKGFLPATLARLVEPGSEASSYRLNLERHQIHIFD